MTQDPNREDPNREICATCKHWRGFPAPHQDMGICTFNPPTVICLGVKEIPKNIIGHVDPNPELEPILKTYFPSTNRAMKCGQHRFDKGRMN